MDSADEIEGCTGSDGMPDCAAEDFSWATDCSGKVNTGLTRTDCTGVAGSTVAVHVVLEVADRDEKKSDELQANMSGYVHNYYT